MKKNNMPSVGKFGKNKPRSRFLRSLRPLIFEIMSFVGRLVYFMKKSPKSEYLNVGCGPNTLSNMDNLDFYQFSMRGSGVVGHDIRFRFPYEDEVYNGIITEHTVEHLTPYDATRLFKEFHRIIRPGGVARIIVPDLEKYIRFYIQDANNEQVTNEFAAFDNGCEAIWNLTQNWEHVSCWDYKMLSKCLLEAGFKSCNHVSFGEGFNSDLLKDSAHRSWESLYVEAIR
jgi:predicted SAM-dependent methyltransferase